MKRVGALLLAACVVPVAFGAREASAANACPYVEPHQDAIQRARALRAQRSATSDIRTLCQLLPQLADVQDEMASNLENAATHPNCRENKTGAGAPELRQMAQDNRRAAAQCDGLASADPARRSSGGCGSDITGTKGGSPAPRHKCDSARQMRAEARKMARSSAPAMAKRFYREAADEYISAGDINLAAVVLRELAALDSPSASAPSASGRSGLAPDAGSGGSAPRPFKMWQPTKDNPDCDNASGVDKQTAAYYNTCVTPEAAKNVKRYQHPIPPKELFETAKARCGSASRENYNCFVDAKVRYVLANDARIRAQCESEAAAPRSALREEMAARAGLTLESPVERRKNILTSCVDREYVYGPNGPPSLRDRAKEEMNRAGVRGADPDYLKGASAGPAAYCRPSAVSWAPNPCCQPGFGMKPTPGAFGAWSCQKLGTFSGMTAEDLRETEQRLAEVAALAVAAADRNLSGQIDEAVRNKCMVRAFAAVHSVMKGGQPLIHERCRALADAARAELAYYADRHIARGDAAVEELLAYLLRGQLGPPQPGVQDLTPDPRMVAEMREMECRWSGGTPENCAALVSPSGGQSAPPPAARTFVRGGISP